MRNHKQLISAGSRLNRTFVFAALLFTLLLPLVNDEAYADDSVRGNGALAKINIKLSGNIVALGCTVDLGDVDKNVNLGEWTTKRLRYPSGHSEPVVFSIHLTGCTASGVTLAFTGTKDATDNTLLALSSDSTARGVAVEIMDVSHKRIAIGDNAERVVVDSQGDAVLNFSARYQTVKTPSAGSADADSEFTLTYD